MRWVRKTRAEAAHEWDFEGQARLTSAIAEPGEDRRLARRELGSPDRGLHSSTASPIRLDCELRKLDCERRGLDCELHRPDGEAPLIRFRELQGSTASLTDWIAKLH